MMLSRLSRRMPASYLQTVKQSNHSLQLRYKSVSVQAAETGRNIPDDKKASCPFTGSTKPQPKLVVVPTLPFFGSLITQYSGTPKFDLSRMYEFNRDMRRKFGDFFSFGFPSFGQGLHGKLYSIQDPEEMLKVIRAEGSYPAGNVPQLWSLVQAFRDADSAMIKGDDQGLLGQGDRWKEQRTFMQTGMLDPRAAKAYIPGIVAAAELASKGAVDASKRNDINYYLNLCAFDMFCTFMFGELTQCADRSKPNNSLNQQENVEFCNAAMSAMEQMTALMMQPTEVMANKVGYKTSAYKKYYEAFTMVREIGMKKLNHFAERYKKGELNELERNSYFANALHRLESDPQSGINYDIMMETSFLALFAGVDTTRYVDSCNQI